MSISVKDLSHTYEQSNVQSLKNVNIEIGTGEFVSIVGPSGCGKSTLLKVLAGLLTPQSGIAEVEGESTIRKPGAVAYMAQRDLLLPWRRAFSNATLASDISKQNQKRKRDQALELFPRFGLAGFEKAWPSQLSGGMRQRLALLRTFLQDKSVVLLDEPFGALDALTRREMHAFLQEVWLADQRTILLVTHDVEEALFLSDRVHVMSPRPGTITELFSLEQSRPRDFDVLDTQNFITAKKKIFAALEGN